jgi:hypothetical protein
MKRVFQRWRDGQGAASTGRLGRGAPSRLMPQISIAALHVLASASPLTAAQHHIAGLLRRSVEISFGHFDVTNQVAERGDDAGRSPLADGACGL